MSHPPAPTKPALAAVIVQFKDADGFWCNAANFTSAELSHAKTYARHVSTEQQTPTRVVLGLKRQVVAEFV